MVRYLSWLANAALFAICCFLVANTANTVFAALMTPEPAPPTPQAMASASRGRDFKVILDRNLFNASLLAPATVAAEEPEDLEATKLPLQLLGTVAAARPEQSWAAVLHTTNRETLILRPNDPVSDGAEVLRIERRRIVLLENGAHRELALDEPSDGNGAKRIARAQPTPRARPTPARRDTANRARRVAKDRYEVSADDEAVRNPASLFQDAQFQPRYEDGEMIGMQVNAVKPGSLFDEVGIQSGEIISELNGILIDSPEASAEVVSELAESEEFTVVVEGEDGSRTLTFSTGE